MEGCVLSSRHILWIAHPRAGVAPARAQPSPSCCFLFFCVTLPHSSSQLRLEFSDTHQEAQLKRLSQHGVSRSDSCHLWLKSKFGPNAFFFLSSATWTPQFVLFFFGFFCFVCVSVSTTSLGFQSSLFFPTQRSFVWFVVLHHDAAMTSCQ